MGRHRKRRPQVISNTQSSTSASDSSFSASADAGKTQCGKKPKTVNIQSVQESLSKFAYGSDSMAAREDGQSKCDDSESDPVFIEQASSSAASSHGVTNEDLMAKLCANGKEISKLSQIIEELRSAVFTLQTENDQLKREVREAKERESELKSKLKEVKFTAELADNRSEELSAYIRRNNIRIYGIEETTEDGRRETIEECEKKVMSLFREKLKVKVGSGDIEAIHRLGTPKQTASSISTGANSRKGPPRGIIVRFISRKIRDAVLYSRRNLRGSRIVLVEDLTPRAYSMLCTARNDTSVCQQAWTKNGKIIVKTLIGKIVTVNSITDLNEHRLACTKQFQKQSTASH